MDSGQHPFLLDVGLRQIYSNTHHPEDRMDDQLKRNHKASLRYKNSLQTVMPVTGELKPLIGFKYKHVYFITKAPPPHK